MRELFLTPVSNYDYERRDMIDKSPKNILELVYDNDKIVKVQTSDGKQEDINLTEINLLHHRILIKGKPFQLLCIRDKRENDDYNF